MTATRSETRLQRTPLAITAVTGDALQVRDFASAQDIGKIVPNATFQPAGNGLGRSVQAYIRGIGQSDFSLAFEPGVSFYVDDQYYALLVGSQFDLLDLERVEVLRGPQGTVFGRNAIGGAVNLIPKAPNADPSGYVDLTYGRFDRLDGRAGLNVPLADKLYLRISGVSKSGRGYMRLLDFRCEMTRQGTPALAGTFPSSGESGSTGGDCTRQRYGGQDMWAARGALRYDGGAADITVSADFTDDDGPPIAIKTFDIVPTASTDALNRAIFRPTFGIDYDRRFLTDSPYTTYLDFADPIAAGTTTPGTFYNGTAGRGGTRYQRKQRVRNYGFNGKGVFELDDRLVFTVLAGYRDLLTTAIGDTDGAPLAAGNLTRSVIDYDQVTVEPRLNYTSGLFDATLGAFYYRGGSTTLGSFYLYTNAAGPFVFAPKFTDIGVTSISRAVYGQAVIRPLDGLSLTLGGRYSRDRKNADYDDGVIVASVPVRGSRFDYRVGLDYKVNDVVLVYGSVATGYKPGAFNPRPYQASQFEPVQGEATTAYELGIKTDLLDRRLRINAAAFYSDYSRRIATQSAQECADSGVRGQCSALGIFTEIAAPSGFAQCRLATPAELGQPASVRLNNRAGVLCVPRIAYRNGPAKIKGLELEIEALPIDGLMLSFNGGYLDLEDPILNADATAISRRQANVPSWTASGAIQYEIEVPSLAGSITPRVDAFYQSAITFAPGTVVSGAVLAPALIEPARVTFNGRVTYANDEHGYEISIGATNLFNKVYYYNLFDTLAYGGATQEGQVAPPREWYLRIVKRF